jgi:3-hydroxybutyryl-CoA dehydrogenase
MGPLALLDLIGLDTAYEILETMYRQGRDRCTPRRRSSCSGHRGLLGRKSGRGFYTYEAPDSPGRRRGRTTPVGRRPAAAARDDHPVGVVGTGTMATGIVEVFAKAGTTSSTSAAPTPRSTACARRSSARSTRRSSAASSRRPPGDVLGRLTGSTSLDDLATVDLVVEAIAEDLRIKTTLFENLDEICKPGAILATTTSSLPIIRCARRPAARRTSSGCTSSTRRRS